MKLAQQLLWGSLALIAVLVILSAIVVDRRIDDRARVLSILQLEREARLIAAQWKPGVNADSLADASSAVSGRRVSLVGASGLLEGDSQYREEMLARLGSMRELPDVAAALDSGRTAHAQYAEAGQVMLHVSVPAAEGAVRTSIAAADLGVLSTGIRGDLLIPGLSAILVSIALATIFARSVSRPVIELRDVARAMARGDLSRRPPISAPGEIGDLSRTLHQLAEQLNTRLGALRSEEVLLTALFESLNEGVLVVDSRRNVVRINAAGRAILDVRLQLPFKADLLPRHRALREAVAEAIEGHATSGVEIELDARNIALTARPLQGGGAIVALFDVTHMRRLEKVRSDFVANVTHELRTPLTIIGGFAETLTDAELPSEKRAEFAESIRSNAVRMQRLVDDLLDLSRIESGGWSPKPVEVDVEREIREGIGDLARRAREKAQELVVQIAPGASTAFADPVAFRHIVANLVDNAVRHTAKGRITISSEPVEDGVRISVADTGAGISDEHIPRIFERFYRVDAGRARERGGTGLGLAIVKHLVEAHGGEVGAKSARGRGTSVWAIFPSRRSE